MQKIFTDFVTSQIPLYLELWSEPTYVCLHDPSFTPEKFRNWTLYGTRVRIFTTLRHSSDSVVYFRPHSSLLVSPTLTGAGLDQNSVLKLIVHHYRLFSKNIWKLNRKFLPKLNKKSENSKIRNFWMWPLISRIQNLR